MTSKIVAAATVVLIAGCAGSATAPGTGYVPENTAKPLQWRAAPAAARRGIYVAAPFGSTIWGYPLNNVNNQGPICTVPWTVQNPIDIAVDRKGRLIEPEGSSGSARVNIGTGPAMCGAKLATLNDPYGLGVDAASNDAANGIIAVADYLGLSSSGPAPGNIALCTVAKGCYADLTSPYMHTLAGVAMDRHGDCWASAVSEVYYALQTLTYFKHCKGVGNLATGYVNGQALGIDIDADGNIVAVDDDNDHGELWVYSRCKPACTLVAGPLSLRGWGNYGHLNRAGNEYAFANEDFGTIDIYAYTPTSLTYEYSFFGPKGYQVIEGVAYNPRSKE
jgi:hypothetical protein